MLNIMFLLTTKDNNCRHLKNDKREFLIKKKRRIVFLSDRYAVKKEDRTVRQRMLRFQQKFIA